MKSLRRIRSFDAEIETRTGTVAQTKHRLFAENPLRDNMQDNFHRTPNIRDDRNHAGIGSFPSLK